MSCNEVFKLYSLYSKRQGLRYFKLGTKGYERNIETRCLIIFLNKFVCSLTQTRIMKYSNWTVNLYVNRAIINKGLEVSSLYSHPERLHYFELEMWKKKQNKCFWAKFGIVFLDKIPISLFPNLFSVFFTPMTSALWRGEQPSKFEYGKGIMAHLS